MKVNKKTALSKNNFSTPFCIQPNKKIEVDIHGMTVPDAKLKLERLIAQVSPNVNEIVVIHGFNGGTSLCNMVRKGLKSKKIKQRILSENRGQTSLILTGNENGGGSNF